MTVAPGAGRARVRLPASRLVISRTVAASSLPLTHCLSTFLDLLARFFSWQRYALPALTNGASGLAAYCSGREPPFSAVKLPARPYRPTIQNRFA